MAELDYETLEVLRKNHPAWRLLAAKHATLVASFLHSVFLVRRVQGVSRLELVSRLEDVLYRFKATGDESYQRDAQTYLDEWAQDDTGWLRKYYPAGADEPHYDLTPATEKALTRLRA